jgi:hypothetical protein
MIEMLKPELLHKPLDLQYHYECRAAGILLGKKYWFLSKRVTVVVGLTPYWCPTYTCNWMNKERD